MDIVVWSQRSVLLLSCSQVWYQPEVGGQLQIRVGEKPPLLGSQPTQFQDLSQVPWSLGLPRGLIYRPWILPAMGIGKVRLCVGEQDQRPLSS